LQRRYGVIRAGLIIGGFWALWHVPMWVGVGWEGQDHLVATVNQAVSIVLFRVVMGWIYANGGRSLFLAIFIHAVDNTCWKLFPNDGSHYNPTAIAAVMVIVTTHHHVRQGATRGGMRRRGRHVFRSRH
jgi:membrane protease YdiL (CAAX protease family)